MEISGVTDVERNCVTGIDIRLRFEDNLDGPYMDDRRDNVLRRRENDAARRFNSNCEQTTLSNVNEFFPFVDEFEIIVFIRSVFGIGPR